MVTQTLITLHGQFIALIRFYYLEVKGE